MISSCYYFYNMKQGIFNETKQNKITFSYEYTKYGDIDHIISYSCSRVISVLYCSLHFIYPLRPQWDIRPLWGCCLWGFSGRILAISVVGVWFRGKHCCNPSSYRVPRGKFYLARIFGGFFSNIHCGTHWSLPCPL